VFAASTNSNNYVPTVTEKKLLSVLANPEFYGKSLTEICRKAEVARDAYYRAFKKPEFVDLYQSLLKDMVNSMAGEVLKAAYRFAVSNAKNNADRRMLLEMAGIFTPRHVKEHIGPGGGPIQVAQGRVADLTDEELDRLLALERDSKGCNEGGKDALSPSPAGLGG